VAPHGGGELNGAPLKRLCGRPAPGCEGVSCTDCTEEELNHIVCGGTQLVACYLSLSPACGAYCRREPLKDCGVEGCVLGPSGARCGGFDPIGAKCRDPADPDPCARVTDGVLSCDGDAVAGCQCVQLEDPELACKVLCADVRFSCEAGSACQTDAGAACVAR
jgi:hypothetical protein